MAEIATSYDIDLQRIYRRNKLRWIALGLSPCFLLFMALIPGTVGGICGICGIVCFLIFGAITGFISLADCPRCYKSAFWKGLWQNPFSSRCLHCGLSFKPQK